MKPLVPLGTLGLSCLPILFSGCSEADDHFVPWRFAHVADIQVGSPRSFRFAPAWNENWRTARGQIIALEPEFLLVGGDLSRDGSIHGFELEAIKADLDSLPFPCHVIPGNMDTGNKHADRQGARGDRDDLLLNVTSEQLEQFSSVFGPLWWSFVHKNLRVSAFCDMIVGSGLPEEAQLWEWLGAQKKAVPAAHHIWMMHYPLFVDRPDEGNWDIADSNHYLDWYFTIDEPGRSRLLQLFLDTRTDRVITGHVHCRKDHHAHGIAFDLAPATCFAQWQDRWPDGDPTLGFYLYTVYSDYIEKTFVPLEKVSSRPGYGPGGHPKPAERDYSRAWEKEGD
ncbi:MAG TPA: metallophosphoesterase [bacterium]|nr:metallophosphoesterase [bacterium]HNT66721.1 metallophosphoesterase [bacterium]